MTFNQYSVYSIVSTTENNDQSDILKVLALLDQVKNLENINEAKDWLKTNWNIRDNIQNFPLTKDVKLSAKKKKKYFNITIEQKNQIESYNFNK